jgi:Zn-dependent protease
LVDVAPLGFLVLVVVLSLVAVVPFVVLGVVASRRGQSMAYMFWGLLGWLGVIIGLLMMMAMPPQDVRRG